MSNGKKKIEIVFTPGCFDEFDGTQEELDALIKQIHDMAESGELFEQSTEVDMLDLLDGVDPADIEEIVNEMTKPRTLQ